MTTSGNYVNIITTSNTTHTQHGGKEKMSGRMLEIKRGIEKTHRQKKHAKQILTVCFELLGLLFIFASMYFGLILTSIIGDLIIH